MKIEENQDKDTDYDYVSSCLNDFMRDETEGVRTIPKIHKNKFVDRFFGSRKVRHEGRFF